MAHKKKARRAPEEQDQHHQQQTNNSSTSNNPEGQTDWYWRQQEEEAEKDKRVITNGIEWENFGNAKDEGLFDFGSNNDKGLEWAAPIDTFAATNLVDGLDDGVSLDNGKDIKSTFVQDEAVPWDIPKKKPS